MGTQAVAQGCTEEANLNHNTAESFESIYLGDAFSDKSDLVKQADPMTYVSPDDPPFLIQKGFFGSDENTQRVLTLLSQNLEYMIRSFIEIPPDFSVACLFEHSTRFAQSSR